MNPATPLPYRPQLTAHTTNTYNPDIELELSPSKARQHATTTQIWSDITTWLTSILSPESTSSTASSEARSDTALPKPFSLPPFERNQDTMAALQQMMLTNMKADGLRKLVHQARLEEVEKYEVELTGLIATESDTVSGTSQAWELLAELESMLDRDAAQSSTRRSTKPVFRKTTLQQLAESCILSGTIPETMAIAATPSTGQVPSPISRVANSIIQTTTDTFSLESQLHEILTLQSQLQHETLLAEEAITSLGRQQQQQRSNHHPTTSTIPSATMSVDVSSNPRHQDNDLTTSTTTTQLTRETKLLTLKLNEYLHRISALERHNADLGTEAYESLLRDVREREKRVEREKVEVRRLEGQLGEFHGLVSDVDVSRQEVRRAVEELEEWKRRREGLFRRLAGNE